METTLCSEPYGSQILSAHYNFFYRSSLAEKHVLILRVDFHATLVL